MLLTTSSIRINNNLNYQNGPIYFNTVPLTIIIIIKIDWQCKARRGRLTPYQSEHPSSTLPAYRGKEDKGKTVEHKKRREQLGQQKGIGPALETCQSHTIKYGVNQIVLERSFPFHMFNKCGRKLLKEHRNQHTLLCQN